MAPPRRDELDIQEQVARLLAVQIRLQVENQTEAILALHQAGFGNSRIGALLGTTADVAKVTVARSASKAKRVSRQSGSGSGQTNRGGLNRKS